MSNKAQKWFAHRRSTTGGRRRVGHWKTVSLADMNGSCETNLGNDSCTMVVVGRRDGNFGESARWRKEGSTMVNEELQQFV